MILEIVLNVGMMLLDALSIVFTGSRRFDFRETVASKESGFALGIERRKNARYLEIRVKNTLGTGRRHYRLTLEEYGRFLDDHTAAASFAAECRDGRHDDRLFRRRERTQRSEPRAPAAT